MVEVLLSVVCGALEQVDEQQPGQMAGDKNFEVKSVPWPISLSTDTVIYTFHGEITDMLFLFIRIGIKYRPTVLLNGRIRTK